LKSVLDASTLINLSNGRVLGVVLRLPDCTFSVGPQVIGECINQAGDISWAFTNGLARLDDDAIPATLFLSILDQFGLGLGETECLAFALHAEYTVCTDDRKARDASTQMLGCQRVNGTMGLLRMCVEHRVLTPAEAMAAYELMKSKGGFLPPVAMIYFEP